MTKSKSISLPKGMTREQAYLAGMADGEGISLRYTIATIKAHIPSLSDEDEQAVFDKAVDLCHGFDEIGATAADLALRTCSCGKRIDGFYEYVDHLVGCFVEYDDHLRKEIP